MVEQAEVGNQMNQIAIQYYTSEIGELIIGSFDNKLCLLDFRYRKKREAIDARLQKRLKAEYSEFEDEIIKQTKAELDQYLSGQRKQFDIPLLMVGSEFQKQVWHALLAIDYGQTASYLQLAKNINNEKAVRAVANANGANAIGIIIPCHRIIGSNGALVGYAGGLPAKKRLLTIEQTTTAKEKQFALDF